MITIDLTPIIKDFMIAAAGAIGGAYGAQIITEKSKSKEDLLKEIRNTNASLSVTFSICNALLGLKKQHIKDLKETYDKQRAGCISQIDRQQKGLKISELRFQADLQQLSLPYQPIEVLQRQLFEKLSVRGRALNLITTLAQTLETLGQAFEKRNELIKYYQSQNLSQDEFNILFFGLPYNGGHINNEYPASIDIIFSFTNDAIFFSYLLGKDLAKHGRRLTRRYKKKYGKDFPEISKSDFSKAITSGLMPQADDYSDWFTMFLIRPRRKRSFFSRVHSKWYFWNKRGLG